VIEGRPDRWRHDVHLRIWLESQHSELGNLGGHQVQVYVAMHPQPVRRHVGAEHDVPHRRVAVGELTRSGRAGGEEGDQEIGWMRVQESAEPRYELAPRSGVGQPGQPAAGAQGRVVEGVVQAGHREHGPEDCLARGAVAAAHHLDCVQGRSRPALRLKRCCARSRQRVVAHADGP
jgi:hypothetical protein